MVAEKDTIRGTKSVLGRVRSSCMLVLRLCYMCDGGVTVRSRYQTNAVQLHDFMKTVWPQAYE